MAASHEEAHVKITDFSNVEIDKYMSCSIRD